MLLEMKDISKEFPGAKVLDKVHLEVREKEIHALLGENGAGKSTLMKILTGIYTMNGGSITYQGQQIHIKGPKQAEEMGIVMIHQEFNLVPQLSIAENIYLGSEGDFAKFGIINWSPLIEASRKYMEQVGLKLHPKTPVDVLSVGEKQLVEIAKALSKKAKILIMDEPTAALTEKEKEKLFEIMTSLVEQGVSIIYISHRMEELFQICDRVTVMRDGQYIATVNIPETSIDELVALMVGREVSERFPKVTNEPGEVLLEVQKFNNRALEDISLELRAGEVVGIGGLMGAGRTELGRAIFGLDAVQGQLKVKGAAGQVFEGRFQHPQEAIQHGLAMVTEDRKDQGLILPFSVQLNLALPTLHKRSRLGVIDRAQEAEMTQRYIKLLKIKTSGPGQRVKSLSGGNQQKVVFGKWLETSPHILILDEPTRGVDVGAKVEIYELMNRLTSQGLGIILISSDLQELIGMSDRVYVMYEGRITGHFTREEITEEAFMHCATGGAQWEAQGV